MRNWFSIASYVLRLKCEEAERIRCIHSVEPVRRYERFAEWLHRLVCKSCRRARRELQILDRTIQDLVASERANDIATADEERALSPQSRQRIAAALHQHDQLSG